jgi:hypothetical protein
MKIFILNPLSKQPESLGYFLPNSDKEKEYPSFRIEEELSPLVML